MQRRNGTNRKELKSLCRQYGLTVAEYKPGDGKMRYRFFRNDFPTKSYDSGYGLYTAFGLREAATWLDGWVTARGEQEWKEFLSHG